MMMTAMTLGDVGADSSNIRTLSEKKLFLFSPVPAIHFLPSTHGQNRFPKNGTKKI